MVGQGGRSRFRRLVLRFALASHKAKRREVRCSAWSWSWSCRARHMYCSPPAGLKLQRPRLAHPSLPQVRSNTQAQRRWGTEGRRTGTRGQGGRRARRGAAQTDKTHLMRHTPDAPHTKRRPPFKSPPTPFNPTGKFPCCLSRARLLCADETNVQKDARVVFAVGRTNKSISLGGGEEAAPWHATPYGKSRNYSMHSPPPPQKKKESEA